MDPQNKIHYNSALLILGGEGGGERRHNQP
jgi:hypothetical protein